MVKAIVFDFFGVICSIVGPNWFRKYFPEEEIGDLMKTHASPADRGKISEKEFFINLGGLVDKHPDEVQSEFYNLAKVDLEVVDLIQNLTKSYKIGLCSDSPSELIRFILGEHGLSDLFDAIVVSSECKIIKPSPEIYKIILGKLPGEAEDLIFVDDNPSNVDGALDVGMKGILFESVEQLKIELKKLGIKW